MCFISLYDSGLQIHCKKSIFKKRENLECCNDNLFCKMISLLGDDCSCVWCDVFRVMSSNFRERPEPMRSLSVWKGKRMSGRVSIKEKRLAISTRLNRKKGGVHLLLWDHPLWGELHSLPKVMLMFALGEVHLAFILL